jgi:hypothetical protein
MIMPIDDGDNHASSSKKIKQYASSGSSNDIGYRL